jgi:hypothetical protein
VYNRGEGVIFKPHTPALISANSAVSVSMQAYRNLGSIIIIIIIIMAFWLLTRHINNKELN